jgi:biotin carboxylase
MPHVAYTDSDRRGLKILMTEGSSNSARQALYALGRHNTVDILDPSPWCQCRLSRFVRRWYRSPSYARNPCEYLTFLGKMLTRERYDVLFSTHEEVLLLSRVRDKLTERVAAAIPEYAAVVQVHSKLKFLALLRELQLPHPESNVVCDRKELCEWSDFPRFVKLDAATAGQGVCYVRNHRDLQAVLNGFENQRKWTDGSPLLLQRPAVGQQAVARAVFRRGELVGIHMSALRVRGVGGAATARTSCVHRTVIEHVRRIGERLAWHGPMFLDYFYDSATESPVYVEADPRIGDTGNATLSDVDICQQCIDVALNRDLAPSPETTLDVRSHSGFLQLISLSMDSATRRDLLREMWRQWRHHGVYEGSRDEVTSPTQDWLSVLPYAWVAAQLLVYPRSGARIVENTVANYSLSQETAEQIGNLPLDDLTTCLGA